MSDLVCETCGEEILSASGPCWNCDESRPVTDWKSFSSYGFRFEYAMKAMRLGMTVRQKSERQGVTYAIQGGEILCNGQVLSRWSGPVLDDGDIMAEDWEVVS